jgi:hypothetical protein
MSFVAAAATVGGAVGLTGTAAVIGGGALIGAGVGGTYSALTGDGNILDSMLTGATIGGLGGWGLSAAGVGAGAAGAAGTAAAPGGVGAGAAGTAAEIGAATNTPALAAVGEASINPATGLPWEATGSGLASGAPLDATNPSWWGSLSGKEKLGYGLAGTTLLGLMGGQPKGVNAPVEKGMIRPYEYSVARREPEEGQSYYAQPIQYDKYGKAVSPLDTSERNYFTQKYNALEPFKAANGGMIPQLQRMPNGGLAAIEGMRDGYGAPMTMDGNIPQFNSGGRPEDRPDSVLRMMQNAKFERDMPDELRDFMRAKRMGLLEGGMMDEEQAALAGGRTPDFMVAPSASQDLRNVNAMAMLNKDLDEDTRLKLMATGYKNPEKKGIGTYGAGITRKLGKDSDLSAFFEQSPDRSYQSYGARYSKRFNTGGGLPAVDGHLGDYSDGGRLLKGPGDGVSDSIPATINNKQPARLADGEFVIPARIVSELGNGSTDAGAKRLYEMMDRIQASRKKTIGKGKVAVDTKAKKHLPA